MLNFTLTLSLLYIGVLIIHGIEEVKKRKIKEVIKNPIKLLLKSLLSTVFMLLAAYIAYKLGFVEK
jgi:hypothetical protein